MQKSSSGLLIGFSTISLLGCVLMAIGAFLIGRNAINEWPTFKPDADPTITAVAMILSASSTPTIMSTPTSQPTETPIPYVTEINSPDQAEMVLISSGEFRMGSDANTDPYFWGAEGPRHIVYLDDYYIYRNEVTTAMYQTCVAAKACPKPSQVMSATREVYYGNPEFADFPVIYVSWVGAASYCKWAGGNLPTEAQWEKAARGTDVRLFPWGDEPPSSGTANFNARDTVQVGSFSQGISPYGAFDMSGNVLEWVFDRFQAGFYSTSPLENPVGPAGGNRRVIRGGAWHHTDASALRVVARASMNEAYTGNDIGFRCVATLP